MAESIESFVAKLQAEGVEAGRAEAARIVEQAKADAEQIVAGARGEAEKIVADAQRQAERSVAQGKAELKMAARDAVLRLRETIAAALEVVFREGAAKALRDEQFLPSLLHDVAQEYARQDAIGDWPVHIRVSDEKLHVATDWAIREMTGVDGEDWRSRIDLRGGLRSAGFEYTTSGGTVEVTPESVAAVLSEMIAPRLRELIDQAVAEKAGD
ncbi:MAG TPA: V-type ATP synthase subunit E family protein [Phycisphaerae bacterium]|nr:V-type ATP synthase subunit E family protein [Phycisphaerae bacterium]